MRLKFAPIITLGIPLVLASFLVACGDRTSTGTSQAEPASQETVNPSPKDSSVIGAKSPARQNRQVTGAKSPATEYRCPGNAYIENTYETENFLIAICFEPAEVGAGRQLYVGTDKSDRSNQIILDSFAGRDGVIRAENGNVTYAINEVELVVTEGNQVILQEPVIATSYKPHDRPESSVRPIPPDEPEPESVAAATEDETCPSNSELDSFYETENFFVAICLEPVEETIFRRLYVGTEKDNPSSRIVLDSAVGLDDVDRAVNGNVTYAISETELVVTEGDTVILSEPVIASSSY